jgi:hypothetical protein
MLKINLPVILLLVLVVLVVCSYLSYVGFILQNLLYDVIK